MSKKAPNEKLLNSEIIGQVDVRRAYFRGNEDEENPEKTLKDKKQQHRMLEISIKLAKALSKLPTVKQRLIFIEQRYGKDCLCDSPSKLELLFQKCGGFDSPAIGENMMQALNGLFLTLKRGTIKDPLKLSTQILGGKPGQCGLVQRLLVRAKIVTFVHEKFHPRLDPDQGALAIKFSTFALYDEHCPSEKEVPSRVTRADLTWMSLRSPPAATLMKLQQDVWDGEMDAGVESALKACPVPTTPLDWIKRE